MHHHNFFRGLPPSGEWQPPWPAYESSRGLPQSHRHACSPPYHSNRFLMSHEDWQRESINDRYSNYAQHNYGNNLPFQALQSNNNPNYPQRGNSYSKYRGKKHQSHPIGCSQPYKKPKTEPCEGTKDCKVDNEQTSQNRASSHNTDGINETKFHSLNEHIQTEEPYWRSKHEVDESWNAPTCSNTVISISNSNYPDALPNSKVDVTASSAANSSTTDTESQRNSNQHVFELIIDDNHDEVDAVNRIMNHETDNLEEEILVKENQDLNHSEHVYASDNTQRESEISKIIGTEATVNSTNLDIPKLVLSKKSTTSKDCWSIKRQNIPSSESPAATVTLTPVNLSISDNNNLRSSDIIILDKVSEKVVVAALSLDGQDRDLNHISSTDHSAPSRPHSSRKDKQKDPKSQMVDTCNGKVNRTGPLFTKSHSCSQEKNAVNEPVQLNLPLMSNSEERRNESDKDIVANKDQNIDSPRDESNSTAKNEGGSSLIIVTDSFPGGCEEDPEEEMPKLPSKRKRPRIISENEEYDDVIIISDDDLLIMSDSENAEEIILENNFSTLDNPTPSSISTEYVPVSSEEISKNLNPQKVIDKKNSNLASKALKSHSNISKHQKSSMKCSKKNEIKIASVNQPVKTKPEHKKKGIASSSLKKSATPIDLKKIVSKRSLLSQLEGKRRLQPVVLLSKLTPTSIAKFLAPSSGAERNGILYKKDPFRQMEYIISFIQLMSDCDLDVSLTSKLNNSKELCNNIVMHCTKENVNNLVQIKYLQKNSEHHRINFKSLSNTEFDIKKLYEDFLDFRKRFAQLSCFIILTNLELSFEAFEHNRVKVQSQGGQYKLIVEEGHELHKKFEKCLILYRIADVLAQSIQKRKQKNFNSSLIKKYHLALVKEHVVLVHTTKGSHGRQNVVAKFHLDFIRGTGLSMAAKELRQHLTKILRSEPDQSMEFSITNDDFGKDVNLDPNPEIQYKEIADALVFRVQAKLLSVKSELQKIVGYILEKETNNIFGFSKEFCRDDKLPGNLNKLRRQIKVLCDHQNIKFANFCRGTITIKDFCNDIPVHKLPIENSKELFKEFFSCFAFHDIQNLVDLLNNDILKIDDETCLNAVQEELFTEFKKERLGKEIASSIKNLISKCKVKKASCKDLQHKNTMNIQFNEKALVALQAKISKHSIDLCSTECILLTELKVKQVLGIMGLTKESLFITNKTLLEMTSDVLNALAHKSTKLLVVQWDGPMEENAEVLDIFSKLLELVANQLNNSMKSVIVIAHRENCLSVINKIRFSNIIRDEQQSFDLSEESRLKLLQADNIALQHRRLSLMKSDLILDEHVPILFESTEIVQQLCTGKLSIGKDLVKPAGFKESFFKTQIKQCIVIAPSIFHEQIEDVFVIRNIDRKDLERFLPPREKVLSVNDIPASMSISARYILLGYKVPSSFFDDYAEKNRERSVHLLRYESSCFVWEKTRGNNMDLLKNRVEDSGDLLKIQKTVDIVAEGRKTVIISGESGAGKSVCLYNLARETKNLYTTETLDAFWPVQVNLDKARLSKYLNRNINIPLERDFVAKFLCSYLELDSVQSKLLTMIFHNQLKIKLALFFDSYEALPPMQRKFFIEVLQELQVSYCEKIYVTSTPSTRSELENGLAVFAYTLDFSEVEKVQFLQSFWSKSFGDVDFTNEAGNVIHHYGRSESNDNEVDDDLTTTPLHLKMLARLCKPNDDDYATIEDRVELYKLYIEHKGVTDEESASLLSLRKILDEDQLKAIGIQKKYPKKGFTLPDDLGHRTFYEYFAAKWLASRNHSLVAKVIDDLLNCMSPLFFKTYLAELNASDDVVGNFAVSGQVNIVRTMLNHCKVKLPLTAIIQSDNLNARQVVRLLLDHHNDTRDEIMLHGEFKRAKYAESSVVRYVNRREKPSKVTPLEVAARMKNVPIACELLLKGANVNEISKEFAFDVARYIADEMCKPDSTWLHPIAEKLLKLRPDAVAHLNKTEEYPRLLSYFFTHGRAELVNLLLKNDRERYNILVAFVDEKSPLDLVNDSRVLSDDERLEIAKYIVTNVGDELQRRNKRYLGNVLKAAAECNHERSFEYFVGKYPGKREGFLESVMRSNRLDLMRFLMRKTDRMMYEDQNTALHKAVKLGVSPTTIKFLVNRGGIDNKNKFGETPLCVAFKEGQDFELVEYLIKRDAHLFEKDDLGLYPWCHAILGESKYTTEEQMYIMKFLQENVKIKAPETEQKISFESDRKRKEVARKLKFFQKQKDFILNLQLYMALKSNDDSWIEFLIRHGANVNHKEADGRMPLHIAIEFKKYKLAKMLLDRGAIFNAKDENGMTPLNLLLANKDNSRESKEIEELFKTAEELFIGKKKYSSQMSRHLLNCRDVQERTLLHVAAKLWDKSVVQKIMRNSMDHATDNKDFPALDVNAKDAKGRTPLSLVKKDVIDIAKELLVYGAIFEPATTPLLQSAKTLIEAVKHKDADRVRKLIKTDCLVNARDECGKSCLHHAVNLDCIEIMRFLLAVKLSDVNATDLRLQTPLHYAVESDNVECVALLLKAGASYDVKNKHGDRPFDLADKTNESAKLLKKIHEMFVDLKSDEPRILVNDNPHPLVEYLSGIQTTWSVSKDVAVNVVDSKKITLLHIATRYDFTSVVENLLRQGAIYNPKNKWKRTPDASAITTERLFSNLKRMSEKLIILTNVDPEIVVNYRDANGYTLLYHCVKAGKKDEVRWLIENGADVLVTSKRGHKITCDKKAYPEICKLLERR